ncbi:MAG TPA: hypothetical protein PLM53_19230 [Spirochaetota bacterium]|nr:hypothetical protein [Spirochaetota bacterium]HPC39643.1 hypothetical protein [Spirochaetota bacterium]HPL15994.1 hypothetical protein [Spirochaetota bacterium]HQF07369.1 hypothetical protein [Spirochaetota bacterium]HQH99227.1 hypothetical protein [Spirochaetota bacterium]
MRTKIIMVSIISAAFLIGCLANLEKYPREKCAALPNDNVFKAIQDNCIKCHPKDFTTKQDICARKAMIIDAVQTGRMPKMGKLWPSYFKTIVEWK